MEKSQAQKGELNNAAGHVNFFTPGLAAAQALSRYGRWGTPVSRLLVPPSGTVGWRGGLYRSFHVTQDRFEASGNRIVEISCAGCVVDGGINGEGQQSLLYPRCEHNIYAQMTSICALKPERSSLAPLSSQQLRLQIPVVQPHEKQQTENLHPHQLI